MTMKKLRSRKKGSDRQSKGQKLFASKDMRLVAHISLMLFSFVFVRTILTIRSVARLDSIWENDEYSFRLVLDHISGAVDPTLDRLIATLSPPGIETKVKTLEEAQIPFYVYDDPEITLDDYYTHISKLRMLRYGAEELVPPPALMTTTTMVI